MKVRIGWTPFRRLIMRHWHKRGRNTPSSWIAQEIGANETRVSDAMNWLEERSLAPINVKTRPIKLNHKNLASLGFVYTGMFDARPRTTGMFYKKLGTNVLFVDSNCHDLKVLVGVFRLSKAQFRSFEAGKLSLVPPGSCAPAANKTFTLSQILHENAPITKEKLDELIASL